MSYVALYRTWRPQDFESLVGQEHIKTALTNALESGKIAHAYLFTGPRGTGKTSTARILAKALNCEQGPTAHPCNVCANCQQITQGSAMDVIEIDAASNRGIDEIRQLRERVAFAPVNGRYKVYIIDEVHMITTDAFNALLKTLEEPPAHVVFILATTEPHKIPATIHSRCQRYDFHRVTIDDIVGQLQKIAAGSDIVADEDALRLMAIQADGGMRDAVSLLDQCAVMSKHINADIVRQVLGIVGREGLRNLVTVIGKGDLSAALQSMSELSAQGKDVKQIILELAEYLRALLLYKADASYEDIYLTDTAEALAALAPLYTTERILAATSRLHQTMEEIKLSAREKIVAEMCIFDLCRIQGDSLEALAARVAQLEAQVAGAQVAPQTKVPGQQAPKLSTVGAAPTTPGHSIFSAEVRPQEQNLTFVSEPQQEQDFESEQEKEFEAEPAHAPQVQPIAAEIKGMPSENGVALWKNLCATLANKKKRTVLVYAELGKVISYDGHVLTLGLSTMMSKERLERTDYKGFIQEILSGLVGHAVALKCVLMKDNELKQIQADKPPVRKTQPKAVKSALDVFGGTVKKD